MPAQGVIYVSNVNGDAAAADGNGYIAKLSLKGEILDKEWVTGLNAPKGLALHDGKLYVSDIDELAVIDTASGEITAKHKAPGATFLNDVTAAEDGRVFVSDMMQNQIWKLEGDQFEMWLAGRCAREPERPARRAGSPGGRRVGQAERGLLDRRARPPQGGRLPVQGDHETSAPASRSATWTAWSQTVRAAIW